MKIFGKTLNARYEKSLLWKIKFSKREENISEIEDITNVEFCHGPIIFADDDLVVSNSDVSPNRKRRNAIPTQINFYSTSKAKKQGERRLSQVLIFL